MLRVNRSELDGLTPQGFRFTVIADPPSVCKVCGSSDLNLWMLLGTVTNDTLEAQFLDTSAANTPKKFYKATP